MPGAVPVSQVSIVLLEVTVADRRGTVIQLSQKGITCFPLPYNHGNLTLLFIWGNFNGNLARFYYKNHPNNCQIITLNSHSG